nr:hypothetical protein HAGR004_39840 [Bdellovibrio sp. HAGR004]
MNKDIIQGKWKEIKGDLRKAWGNITDDEWEKTKGDATAIAGIIQQKYGIAKEEASEKVGGVLAKYIEDTRKTMDKDIPPQKRN